jgi:hypothetical protein
MKVGRPAYGYELYCKGEPLELAYRHRLKGTSHYSYTIFRRNGLLIFPRKIYILTWRKFVEEVRL